MSTDEVQIMDDVERRIARNEKNNLRMMRLLSTLVLAVCVMLVVLVGLILFLMAGTKPSDVHRSVHDRAERIESKLDRLLKEQ